MPPSIKPGYVQRLARLRAHLCVHLAFAIPAVDNDACGRLANRLGAAIRSHDRAIERPRIGRQLEGNVQRGQIQAGVQCVQAGAQVEARRGECLNMGIGGAEPQLP